MASIEIEGNRYKVLESLGYNHDAGCYAKIVADGDRERMAVKQAGGWRFWSAADRVKPLVDAIKRGWPDAPAGVRGQ